MVVAQALAAVGQRDAGADEVGSGVMSLTAEARAQGHARFTIHVIVRTNARPEGRRYEVLSRERLWQD
jgi:hypothetical protein